MEKKRELDSLRPLPQVALNRLRTDIALEWTYNSNGIEGNTLTLNETRVVLEDGMTIGGKSIREHLEATNHASAIQFLESIVGNKRGLTEREVLDLHALVLYGIDKEFCGRFRNAGVRIVGANFTPPNMMKVPGLMAELFEFVNTDPLGLSPLVMATLFHHRLVWIHPFFDGNGRTVRLAMNLLLMREGFPPAIILMNDRKKYYDALNQANNGSYTKLLLLVCQAMERSLNIFLNSCSQGREDYVPITQLVKEQELPYGSEYISLLARRGQIDAHKEGRDWLTTGAAVRSYVAQRKRNRKPRA
jgi:Fic family protein